MPSTSSYKSLDANRKEIRVLILEPGERCVLDTLKCSLEHISLLDEGRRKYETISYHWGDPSTSSEIALDGEVIGVPRSSEMALRCMRLPEEPRVLWIDAVCINQANDAERAQQVSIMGDIYRNGTRNLVYLGEGDEHTASAVRSIEMLMREEISGVAVDIMSLARCFVQLQGISPTGLTMLVDEVALTAFYAQPWFRRLWIIQEVVLSPASICHCGSTSIDMSKVLMTAVWIWKKAAHAYPKLQLTLQFACAIICFTHICHSLRGVYATLMLARNFECAGPLDKVFALLGLIDWTEFGGVPDALKPDYNTKLSRLLVSASYYGACSRDTGLLRCISHIDSDDIHVDGLPSWVPRWHRHRDASREPTPLPSIHQASLGVARVAAMTPEDIKFALATGMFGKLCTHGYIIDTVQRVFLTETLTPMDHIVQNILQPLQTATFELSGLSGPSDTSNNDMYREVTAGGWTVVNPITEEQLVTCQNFCDHLQNPMSKRPFPDGDLLTEVRAAVGSACKRRTTCTTKRSLLPPLVPDITHDGDVLVLVFGADTPYVLRPCQNDEYEVIGECYIHGMMQGEAVEEWKASGKLPQEFTLI